MPIRMKKKTSTAIVTADFNLSRPGDEVEVDVRYTLTEVTISAEGKGVAKFNLSIDGATEGIKQSFPFSIQNADLFAEIERLICSLPEFSGSRLEG
ncbi:TPA: hypothetical protein ACSTL5_003853 [Serratia fonticola]